MLAADPIYTARINHGYQQQINTSQVCAEHTHLIFSWIQLKGMPSTPGMMVKYRLLLRLPFRQISVKILVGRKIAGTKYVRVRTLLSSRGNHLRVLGRM
jgi:hypothetical protein